MKICIGLVTRKRPEMLRQALFSLARMQRPADADLSFIVVENNPVLTIGPVIDAVRTATGLEPITLGLAATTGIPFARNVVLAEALRQQADILTFIDDDEVVDEAWLVNGLACLIEGNFDLVGGPVLVGPCPNGASAWQAWLWDGHRRRCQALRAKLIRRMKRKGANSVNVTTANWFGRLEFFRRTGLRFDETIGQGSGSDRRLYQQAKQRGARCGWAGLAPVYDTIPKDRLALGYTFRRGREHTSYLFADREKRPAAAILLAKACVRGLRAAVSALSVPFAGATGLVDAARLSGDAFGFLDAARGISTSHYLRVTGQ